jgi:predicted patatin/cPLA2 family phospholipase
MVPHDDARGSWATDHPVLGLLRERRATGSLPGARNDDYRLALAIEGGGMRGIVSGAMLNALEDRGLGKCFDAVYGCSSGAVNAAYFLAGETWYPLSIYYDDLSSNEFLDFRRALLGRAVLDLHYAYDIVVERIKPLDYPAVLASPVSLHVAVTLVDEMIGWAACGFQSKDDLKAALRASGWLPVATKGTAVFRGKRALDGGVLTPHPFRFAVEDGFTHILSLSTRPTRSAGLGRGITAWQRLAAWRLERIKRGLGRKYLCAITDYAKERAELERVRIDPTPDPYVLDLAPLAGTPEIKRHEKDLGRLLAGARSAYRLVVLAIDGWDVQVIPRLTIPEHERGGPITSPTAQSGLDHDLPKEMETG